MLLILHNVSMTYEDYQVYTHPAKLARLSPLVDKEEELLLYIYIN